LDAIREITEEKQMYDAREKASLDIQSNLIDARQEGRREGRQEGRQEGIEIGEQRGKLKASVQIYEGLLGESVTSDSELNNQTIESLEAMVTQLQKRLRNRTS
jgi:predicted transposase YdaD